MKKQKEIVGVILAAGLSSRMGELKQLLPIGGHPAVCRIARVLKENLRQVIVVVGHRAEEVQDALSGTNCLVYDQSNRPIGSPISSVALFFRA